jgi:hypothetical protein
LLCLHYPRFFLFLFPPWRSNRRIHKSSSTPSTAATTTTPAYVVVSRFFFSTVTNWPIVTITVIITADFFVVSPTVYLV